VKLLQKSDSGRPRFVMVVCSLKCIESDLICWQFSYASRLKHISS